MASTFIRGPVLAIVVSLVLLLLGGISPSRLPMALFPSVAPPEVNVTIEYTGANAETVTKAALVPLERAINGVPRMKYMSSDAGNDGVGVVQILFETGTDPDIAAVNVQNRVSSVMGDLPGEVRLRAIASQEAAEAPKNHFSFSDGLGRGRGRRRRGGAERARRPLRALFTGAGGSAPRRGPASA